MPIKFLNDVAVDTSVLYVDTINNRVGIGTTNPRVPLQVSSDIIDTDFLIESGNTQARMSINNTSTGDPQINFQLNNSSKFTIGVDNSDSDKFKISGGSALGSNDRIVVDSSGNVGIGTTSPARKLEVYNGSSSIISQFTSGSATSSFICFANAGSTADQVRIGSISSNLVLSTNYTERMRIDSSGNVGIGTISPLAKLDVGGNFRINTNNLTLSSTPSWGVPTQNIIGAEDNTNGATLTLMNTSATIPAGGASGTLQFVALADARNQGGAGYATASISTVSTSAPVQGTSGKGNLIFKTSAGFGTVLERMRINSSGVGIGTTSPSAPLTFGKSVYGDFDSENFYRIKLQDQGGTHNDVGIGQTASGNMGFNITSGGAFIFNNGTSGEIARFNGTGLGIGTTSPSEKLHVSGNARVTGAYYDSNNSPGTSNQVLVSTVTGTDWIDGTAIPGLVDGTGTANYVARWGGTESIGTGVIYDNGNNVGINATSLYSKLHIGNSSNVNSNLLTMESSGPVWVHLKTSSNSQSQIGFGDNQFVNQNTRGRITYNSSTTTADNYMSFTTNFAEVMRITNSNVGIGTTSPAHKLHVVGTNNDPIIRAVRGNNTSQYLDIRGYQILSQGNHLLLTADDTKEIWLGQESNTQRMVIDSSGNVGIGTTSPGAKLEVKGPNHDGNFTSGSLMIQSATTNDRMFIDGNDIDAADGVLFLNDYSLNEVRTGGNFTVPNGNVGIGTTSPSEKLNISGGNLLIAGDYQSLYVGGKTDTGNDGLRMSIDNAGNGFFDHKGAGKLHFRVDNSQGAATRMVIDSSGNVGIGTTSPGQKLSVAPDTDVSAEIGKAHIGQVGFNGYAGFSHVDQNTQQGYALIQYSDGSTYMNANTGKNIRFRIANSDKMILDSSGKVGIGTTSPAEKLHVYNGSAYITPIVYAANQNDWVIRTGAYNNTSFDQGLKIKSTSGGTSYMAFETAHSGGETMVLRGGNVGIGLDNPSSPLEVYSSAAGKVLEISMDGTYPTFQVGLVIDSVNTYGQVAQFKIGGSTRGSISWSGSAGVAYNTTSDYRVKENVIAITDGIERLKQLKPSRFNFINSSEEVVDGFIAHEVQSIIPEAIAGEKDAIEEDGSPRLQGIDQSKIVPLLTAALQEAITKIENLESRIQTLENQ